MRKALSFLAVLAVLTAGAYVHAQRLMRLDSWELDYKGRPPRVIEIREDMDLRSYTYVIYEVTNNTDTEIDFHPAFEIETNEARIRRAVSRPDVFARINARSLHELKPFRSMKGPIRPGETKRGVAIFETVDTAANTLTVYVSGLTGDFVTRTLEDGQVKALYRTYKSVYYRPGDGFQVTLEPVSLVSSEWIWR